MTSHPSSPAIDAERFATLVHEGLVIPPSFRWRVLRLARGFAEVELEDDPAFVRPGGTISGPTLFTLADLTLWAAVLSVIGPQPLAVTAEMAIHFLRRPKPDALVARCDVLKAGRRLVHGDVRIASRGEPDVVVCHATGSYAVPGDGPAVRSSTP